MWKPETGYVLSEKNLFWWWVPLLEKKCRNRTVISSMLAKRPAEILLSRQLQCFYYYY